MQNKVKNQLPALFMMFFGILLIWIIPSQISDVRISTLGPRFFPYFLSGLVVVLSIISIIAGLRNDKQEDEEEQNSKENNEKPNYTRVILLFCFLILWMLLIPVLGFIIVTIPLIFVAMLIIGNRKKLQLIILPIVFTLLIHFVFKSVLHVPLPDGIFL